MSVAEMSSPVDIVDDKLIWVFARMFRYAKDPHTFVARVLLQIVVGTAVCWLSSAYQAIPFATQPICEASFNNIILSLLQINFQVMNLIFETIHFSYTIPRYPPFQTAQCLNI